MKGWRHVRVVALGVVLAAGTAGAAFTKAALLDPQDTDARINAARVALRRGPAATERLGMIKESLKRKRLEKGAA